jgi:hypothetical protein
MLKRRARPWLSGTTLLTAFALGTTAYALFMVFTTRASRAGMRKRLAKVARRQQKRLSEGVPTVIDGLRTAGQKAVSAVVPEAR